METAVIGGKEYTKEQIIEIGKEHFDAAKRLRQYGIFILAFALGVFILSLVFFILYVNNLLVIDGWVESLLIYGATCTGMITSGIIMLVGIIIIILSFIKSDEKEYIKAGVIYLNNQADKEQK